MGLLTFLIIDTADERVRLQSFGGLLVFLLLGWIFSKYPSRVILCLFYAYFMFYTLRSLSKFSFSFSQQVKWRHVSWGIALQLIFGLIVLRWDFGRRAFECLGSKFSLLLDYSVAGSEFVFGYLANDENTAGIALGTIFAFRVSTTAFLFLQINSSRLIYDLLAYY